MEDRAVGSTRVERMSSPYGPKDIEDLRRVIRAMYLSAEQQSQMSVYESLSICEQMLQTYISVDITDAHLRDLQRERIAADRE